MKKLIPKQKQILLLKVILKQGKGGKKPFSFSISSFSFSAAQQFSNSYNKTLFIMSEDSLLRLFN